MAHSAAPAPGLDSAPTRPITRPHLRVVGDDERAQVPARPSTPGPPPEPVRPPRRAFTEWGVLAILTPVGGAGLVGLLSPLTGRVGALVLYAAIVAFPIVMYVCAGMPVSRHAVTPVDRHPEPEDDNEPSCPADGDGGD